jgi:tetratricopeptide (TPR) repeat protein
VVNNPAVNQGLNREGVALAFTRVHSSNWIPLTWLSHALDTTLFGLDAGAHHLVNLLLHGLNIWLVFAVLRALTGPEMAWRAALVAGIFALHPAHVETVAWVSERKGTLSSVFWWLALWAYAAHARRPSGRMLMLAGIAMALGLLAKASLVVLPLLLLLLDFWPLRRLRAARALGGEAAPETVAPRSFASLLAEKLPLFALALAAAIATFAAQRRGGAMVSVEELPLAERIPNAALSTAHYLVDFFWPADLAVLYPRLPPEALAWLGPAGAAAALLLGLSAVCLGLARRAPYLLVGWLWFLLTLAPVIGIVQVGSQARADRYTYLSYVGLSLALVWGAAELWPRVRGRRVQLAALGMLVLLACAAATRAQLVHWSDSIALWRHTSRVTRDNVVAYAQLAHSLLLAGRVDEALPEARRAAELGPDSVLAHHNLAVVFQRQGRLAAAGAEYKRALEADPDFAPSQLSRALLLHRERRFEEAVALFEPSLGAEPQLWQVEGVRFRYQDSLGQALARGRMDFDTALRRYRAALALDPSWAELERDLAWMLATHPESDTALGREALAHARRIAGSPEESSAYDLETLAAAHAAAGEFEQAAEFADLAVERARGSGLSEALLAPLRERAALYRQRRRYVEDPRASR